MAILVLAQDYPTEEKKHTLAYIHTRNKYYNENGLDITVLNFSAKEPYLYDGIRVITEQDYFENSKYKKVISHAPNIKNHYRFIKKNKNKFEEVIFFYHGHEILI